MSLQQDGEIDSCTPTQTSTPSPLSEPLSDADDAQLRDFRQLLSEFLGVKGQIYNSRHAMTLNLRANENRRGPVSASSPYRGVTQHKKTRKWESHLWKQGKQLYCGAFGDAADAAKAHDILALRIKGPKAVTNFQPQCYSKLITALERFSEVDVIDCLRRCAQGNSDTARRAKRPRLFKSSSDISKGSNGVSGGSEKPLWSLKNDANNATYVNNAYYKDAFGIQPTLFAPVRCEVTAAQLRQSTSFHFHHLPEPYPLYTPSIGWQYDGGFSNDWLDSDVSTPLSSLAQLPVLQGHVIRSELPLLQHKAESPIVKIGDRLPQQPHTSSEEHVPSNGSNSDQEMQAIVRAISFRDELEIERHIAEGLVDCHHSSQTFL